MQTLFRNRFVAWSALSLLAMVAGCSSSFDAVATEPAGTMWVVAWGATPENAAYNTENIGGAEKTFRSFFYPTVAGTMERVHFSNTSGLSPVTIGAARLAIATTGPAIDASHDVALTFGGSASVTIPAGGEIVSDTVEIAYSFGQKMAVSMYLPGGFPSLTQHESQVQTNYGTPDNGGNATGDAAGASLTVANTEWFLLSGMDVYGKYQGTVALFGSSSIDGHASNYGDSSSYPVKNVAIPGQDNDRPSDWLARSLHAAGYNLGVLNAGILGDTAGPSSITFSPPGIARIGHDVLQQPGVKAVVIYLGSVDLRVLSCKNATDVEGYLENMVSQAKAAGVRVVLGTLPPATFCSNSAMPNFGPFPSAADPYAGDITPGPENPDNLQRRLLNDWIRTTGAQLPGVVGIADFDAVLADPMHPDFLLPNLNSGDNFHPNGVGYQVQNSAIPLGSLLAQ